MQFPYTEVGKGQFRPLIPLFVTGSSGFSFSDGLVDSGADRTLLAPKVVRDLDIDVGALTTSVRIRSTTGQVMVCPITTVTMELRRNANRIRWFAEVALATQDIPQTLWGFRGFMEFFRTKLDGPNRKVHLTPGDNLPKAPRPHSSG